MNNVMNWLLEDNNPAIKYRTMTEICGISPEESKETYELVCKQKSVLRMLGKQSKNGLWSNDYGMFTPLRYLTAFAELGMQKDERLNKSVDFTVTGLQSLEKEDNIAGCGSALTLRALIMLGYHELSEVKDFIMKFAEQQLYDGGFMCKMKLEKKPERKSCCC